MTALQVSELVGPSGLRVVEVAAPDDPDAVIVEVYSAGVSFPDLLMTQGRYQRKPPLPFTPGVEVAGVVVAAPEGAAVTVGDRVAGFVRVGGWATRVAVRPELVFPLPDTVSFRSAAGMPMNYLTAHLSLKRRGGLRAGEVLVVHGAAGGLGTALVQTGKALGAQVVAIVSTPEKAEFVSRAGADHVVNVDQWLESVRELFGSGVDVVADPVGGDRLLDSIRVLNKEGRLLVLGFADGTIPTIPANRVLLKNVDVRGVAWGSLIEDEPDFPAEQWDDVLQWVSDGYVRPVDGPERDLERADEALRLLQDRHALGKVTLRMKAEISVAEQKGKTDG